MIAGDVVNTAARLQSAAPVEGVLVGEETFAATRGVIGYGPASRSTRRARGAGTGVALSRPRPWASTRHRVPLVGRGRELGR